MMQNLLEMRPTDWTNRVSLCSCCGSAYGLWQMSLGMNVVLSTQPLEDSEVVVEKFPMYKMCSHSVEVGAGNYLNMQWMSRTNVPTDKPYPGMVGEGPLLRVQHMPPPIKDGPPVYACYFSSIQGTITYGLQEYVYQGPQPPPKRTTPQMIAEALPEFAKQINNCHLFFITVGPHQHVSFARFLDLCGWNKDVVWRSPMFNNLNYNRPQDTLQLTLIKRNN